VGHWIPSIWSRHTAGVYYAGDMPDHLSPSGLKDYLECPRRYQHSRIDALRSPDTIHTLRGKIFHSTLERLMALPGAERTIDAAHSLLKGAWQEIMDRKAHSDLNDDRTKLIQLANESKGLIDNYFALETPSAVNHEGVERKISSEIGGAPILGILDRVDRERDHSLSIVDYKTGSVPPVTNERTFAPTQLYAALHHATTGEMPDRIRLLYITHGTVLEQPVDTQSVERRAREASESWKRINDSYSVGNFPAVPSSKNCRHCAFKAICKGNGVAVPETKE
jgi:putative RecB family exonuclease